MAEKANSVVSMQQVELSNSSFKVRVYGWGSPRLVSLHRGFIYFQAATCFPCPTCNSRVDQLTSSMQKTGHSDGVDKLPLDNLLFFVIPHPGIASLPLEPSPKEISSFLSIVFNLLIEPITDSEGKPIQLPTKSLVYFPSDELRWDMEKKSSRELSVEGNSLEWRKDLQAAWLCAETTARLFNGKYSLEFWIDAVCARQLGIGFLLVPPNWGFFGYLGASDTAWSYDVWEGALVTNTKAIHTGLPTIKESGSVVLMLDLSESKCTARFVLDGKETPEISLPPKSMVIPAASLLAKGQKVTLKQLQKR